MQKCISIPETTLDDLEVINQLCGFNSSKAIVIAVRFLREHIHRTINSEVKKSYHKITSELSDMVD